MSLADFLDQLQWAGLAAALAGRFQVNARAYDEKGALLGPGAPACNPLCRAVCGHPGATRAVCGQSLAGMAEDAREEGKTVISECEAGLGMILVPVFMGGRYAGALTACGWLDPDEGDVDTLLIEEETGIPEDDLEALIEDIREASTSDLRDLLASLKDAAAKAHAA